MSRLTYLPLFILTLIFSACTEEKADMSNQHHADFQQTALAFTQALAARDYAKAYAMTTVDYQQQTSVNALQASFESIVPPDWGEMGPIELGHTMKDWPGRQSSDLGWAYVSIGGKLYSEALVVVVTAENSNAKIREIQFGRP